MGNRRCPYLSYDRHLADVAGRVVPVFANSRRLRAGRQRPALQHLGDLVERRPPRVGDARLLGRTYLLSCERRVRVI